MVAARIPQRIINGLSAAPLRNTSRTLKHITYSTPTIRQSLTIRNLLDLLLQRLRTCLKELQPMKAVVALLTLAEVQSSLTTPPATTRLSLLLKKLSPERIFLLRDQVILSRLQTPVTTRLNPVIWFGRLAAQRQPLREANPKATLSVLRALITRRQVT